jgi:hypothetical protein
MTTTQFTVEVQVSMDDLWTAIWGSEGSGITYWAGKIRKLDDSAIKLWTEDWEPNPQDFKLYDFQEEKWHTITLGDLARAYKLAQDNALTHCGKCEVANLEDPDECTGDILIQLAVFGDIVYG